MPVLLFVLVVTGVIILFVCFISWLKEKRKKPSYVSNLKDIVKVIYKEVNKKKNIDAGIKLRKITILEKLNITPVELEACLKELLSKRIIEINKNDITLTDFGDVYYKVFVSKSKKKNNVGS